MAEKVPRIVGSVDVRKFKLDPMDGFLLTRIDGKLGPKELARDTGLPDFSVDRAIEKLLKLGIVELVDPNAPPPKEKKEVAFAALSEPKYDPAELEEDCDLQPEMRKRVLDLFYRLDDLDHWTLLGLSKDADKKGIKRAYFELAKVMHPDSYFKKNLGKFKPKMEVLFARITDAHDTLVDPDKRAEYETYLAEVETTRGMEAMLERAMAEQAAAAAAAAAAGPAPEANAASDVAISHTPAARTPSLSPQELQARREALARRLVGGNSSVRPAAASAPPVEKPNPLKYANSSDAMDALKRRYEDRIEHATVSQANKYVKSAEESLAKGDYVAAASNYGIATRFSPNDVALAQRAQEVRNEADKIMCDSYLKQAQYEERSGHWPEAARSWAKVARIKPTDASVRERTANAILKAEGDLHDAAEHAKQAIAIDPGAVAHHVTLAEIYVKAGLSASARVAAEAGLQVEADNATLKGIVKKFTK
jgi:curved DNA-binding protein CbpA